MVTAYEVGQAHELAARQMAVEAASKAKKARKLSPMAEASTYFKKIGRHITHKIGNILVTKDADGHYFLGQIEIGRLLATDPQQALRELAKLPHGADTRAAYREAFRELADKVLDGYADTQPVAEDGPKAAALAESLPPGPERTAALLGVADGWAQISRTTDSGAALLDWASGLPAEDESVLKQTVESYMVDPKLAAQYIDDLTSATDRGDAIHYIAMAMAQVNPGSDASVADTVAAIDWLKQTATGDEYFSGMMQMFDQLSENDPARGVAVLDTLTDPHDRSDAIKELSTYWGTDDPKATLEWLQTLPEADGAARTRAINWAMSNWAKNNLPEATAYVSGVSDPAVFLSVAPILAPAMAKTDPQAALKWVGGFPDSATKAQAVSGVLNNMATTDFNGAWSYATSLPEGMTREGAMDSLVSTLSTTNPAQAATLLGQLGSDAASVSATDSVAYNWASRDSAGLAAWINTQPAGSVRDTAVAAYVSEQDGTNPAALLALANTMNDPAKRSGQIKDLLQQWAKTDLPAASAAAQTANLTESERASLLLQLSKANGK